MDHTLLFCPSWMDQLFDILGLDASDRTYGAVVRSAVNSSRFWTTLANFCEVMMKKKVQTERER